MTCLENWLEVSDSTICDGKGLFAKKDIPVNTIIFDLKESTHIKFDQKTFEALVENFPDFADQVTSYGYYDTTDKIIILNLDDSRYMNHSTEPNIGWSSDRNPDLGVTLRKIEKGEEVFEDYRDYAYCPWAKLYGDLNL